MKDRQQNIGQAAQWAYDKIAQRLGQEPMGIESARGREAHFKLTDPENPDDLRWLSFRPDEGSAEFSTLGLEVQVSMRGILPPRPTRSGVIFESADGRARGLVLSNGHAVFEVMPFASAKPLESPTGIPGAQETPLADSARNAAPRGAQDEIRASAEPSAPATTEGRERQQKVKWTGYIANDPVFGNSRDGSPRANFIVSEHVEDDKTIYHKVYTTRKEAQRLQDAALAKGMRVRVDGYKQPRQRQNRDGTTTPEERVYAVHVTIYKPEEQSNESPSPTSK